MCLIIAPPLPITIPHFAFGRSTLNSMVRPARAWSVYWAMGAMGGAAMTPMPGRGMPSGDDGAKAPDAAATAAAAAPAASGAGGSPTVTGAGSRGAGGARGTRRRVPPSLASPGASPASEPASSPPASGAGSAGSGASPPAGGAAAADSSASASVSSVFRSSARAFLAAGGLPGASSVCLTAFGSAGSSALIQGREQPADLFRECLGCPTRPDR